MENKYYTPELEELFIGYECEALQDCFIEGFDFRPYRVVSLDEKLSNNFLKLLRTKYLDKEDIESLGWINIGHDKFQKGDNILYLTKLADANNNVTRILQICIVHEKFVHYRYQGSYKSINEFKTLMKWLKIN